jgi:hypothetical protein
MAVGIIMKSDAVCSYHYEGSVMAVTPGLKIGPETGQAAFTRRDFL